METLVVFFNALFTVICSDTCYHEKWENIELLCVRVCLQNTS